MVTVLNTTKAPATVLPMITSGVIKPDVNPNAYNPNETASSIPVAQDLETPKINPDISVCRYVTILAQEESTLTPAQLMNMPKISFRNSS